MSLDVASAVIKLRDLTVKFDNGVRSASPFYPRICTVVNSKRFDEKYSWLGSVSGVREWLGDRIFNQLRAAHFTLANKKFELSQAVEKDDIDDDNMGMYPPMLEEMGKRFALHPDELVLALIEAGGGAGGVCWDGQYFFDTDHVWGDSGSQSNALTYDASSHTAVTAAEFAAAFHAALIKMISYVDDKGKALVPPVFDYSSMQLEVLVPPALYKAAVEGLTADLIGGGNTNIVVGTPKVIPVPGFTSAVKWYLVNTSASLKPLVFQQRQAVKRQMKGMEDIEFKDVKFMADARYNAGYLAWWNMVQTTFN